MKHSSIKKITLSRLIKVFIFSIFVVLATVALSFRSFFQVAVENKAIAISDVIKAGLTAHMKADIMDKRAYFLSEIASVYDIESINVIRSKNVIDQYGEAKNFEKASASLLQTIIQTEKPTFIWRDTESKVEAIIPYVASSTDELNCLSCHNAKKDEILGAVNIVMNIGMYQELAFRYSYILFAVLSFFALMIVYNMFYVIEHHVKRPLSKIIEDGHSSYDSGEEIDSDDYESFEFVEVAQNINDFNQRVLKRKNELIALNKEIDLTLEETLMAMGEMEEIRSDETRNHTKRVALLSASIAKKYGLSDEQVRHIELASPLHDIGKIAIEDAILKKPGKLTTFEYDRMKSHTILGYKTLKHSKRVVLKAAAEISYCHHEKHDGSGYPNGLKGEEIPLYARIVAAVDVLDALLSKRVYKETWTKEAVVEFFERERGLHFEPKVADIVLDNIDEFSELIKNNS